MRTLIAILLISLVPHSYSQTRNIKININYTVSAEIILVKLTSQEENLNTCTIQILDSTKKTIQTLGFPKAIEKLMWKQYTETGIPTKDLPPGRYTWVAYLGKEEFYRRSFSNDKK